MARPNIQVSSNRENCNSHTTSYCRVISLMAPTEPIQGQPPLPQSPSAPTRTWVRSPKWRWPANLWESYSIFTRREVLKQSTTDGHPQNPQLDFWCQIPDILLCKDLIIKRHPSFFKSEWKQSWFRPDISVVRPTPSENWKNKMTKPFLFSEGVQHKQLH